jgi:tetratricopeptide (TPR) repeat protein
MYADTFLALNPSLPSTHFWKAMTSGSLIPFGGVLEKLRLGKEVRFQSEKTIDLDSTFALAYIILAIFERESAQLSWLERAIAKIIFGEELHGSFEASEEFLAKAVKYDPANSYAYYEMYWTYLAEGRKNAAAESLKKVLAIPAKSHREEQQHQFAQNYLENLQKSSE